MKIFIIIILTAITSIFCYKFFNYINNFNPKHHIIHYYSAHGEMNYYPDTFYLNNGCLLLINKNEKQTICGDFIIKK